RFQHEVEALEQSAESMIVSIRTPEGALVQVQCEYLLACDGGKSSVRNALNIPLQGTTFAQRWLVIDAFVSETMENEDTSLPVDYDSHRRGWRIAARGPAAATSRSPKMSRAGSGRRTPARGPAATTHA